MPLTEFIRRMPKVELHVHLEGSIQPETLLILAQRNGVQLPATDVPGLRQWYTFTNFAHFIETYLTISSCICTPDDIELIAKDFLRGQAQQNIRYSEVTFTAYTHYSLNKKIPFADQLAALSRARNWAADELDVGVGWVLDIVRNVRPVEHGTTVAEWAISGKNHGVAALGLGGLEVGHPPELFQAAFDLAHQNNLPSVPHAGEIGGADGIWSSLKNLHAVRIGHGVRCLEDENLVAYLREQQIPLEVCPTSNVCLGVAPSLAEHPLPKLLEAGLYVTINSDDPPMFNTTLTDEYLKITEAFNFDIMAIERFVLNAVNAALLPPEEREKMANAYRTEFQKLREELHLH